ncbi:MAG: hypothetical protein V1933_05785 [Candidatus Omnitrophota bacterium]
MNLDPPRLELSAPPGGSKSGVIKVGNPGDVSLKLKAYVQDWIYDPPGNRVFKPAGTTPLSCSNWIHLYPEQLEVKPGEKAEIMYTLSVPADAKGGRYAVIFFEGTLGSGSTEEGVIVRLAGRMGTIVLEETEGTVIKKGEIASLKISRPDENKPLDIEVSFKNEGNVFLAPSGVVNIIDKEGNFFGRQEFQLKGTLPGDTIEGKVSLLSSLPEGEYDVIATLDLGAEEAAVKETKLAVIKKGEIERFDVAVLQDKPPVFSINFSNDGNLNIETEGKIDIVDDNGQVVASSIAAKSLIAPDSRKEISIALDKKLPSGEYKARAIFNFDGQTVSKENRFSIK